MEVFHQDAVFQGDFSSGWFLIASYQGGLSSKRSFTRMRSFMVISHQDGFSLPLIKVVSHQGGLICRVVPPSGWSLIKVVSHYGGLHQDAVSQGNFSSGWSLIASYQGGLSSGWSHLQGGLPVRVVSHQGGLSSRRSFNRMRSLRVISHQDGLSFFSSGPVVGYCGEDHLLRTQSSVVLL